MHELWLCKNILEIVNQKLLETECKQVKRIYLEIGELVAVDKAALIFSFEVVAKETIVQDALLEIISIAGEAICDSCKNHVRINHYSDSCPYCGHFSLNILCGEEFCVKSMEVE